MRTEMTDSVLLRDTSEFQISTHEPNLRSILLPFVLHLIPADGPPLPAIR